MMGLFAIQEGPWKLIQGREWRPPRKARLLPPRRAPLIRPASSITWAMTSARRRIATRKSRKSSRA